jgi:hypothetical protein
MATATARRQTLSRLGFGGFSTGEILPYSFQPCIFTGDISPKTENKNSQCENEVTFVIKNSKKNLQNF